MFVIYGKFIEILPITMNIEIKVYDISLVSKVTIAINQGII